MIILEHRKAYAAVRCLPSPIKPQLWSHSLPVISLSTRAAVILFHIQRIVICNRKLRFAHHVHVW
jgi:hypothetical protein